MNIDSGGSAFPCMPPQDTAAGAAVGYPHPEVGMTMRDYFAAKAMQAGMTGAVLPGLFERDPETLAAVSKAARAFYAIADAMLEARDA